jgi:hypothetical protein
MIHDLGAFQELYEPLRLVRLPSGYAEMKHVAAAIAEQVQFG